MKVLTHFAFFVVSSKTIFTALGHENLIAVSDSPYTERLYQQIKNEDPPSELDPATTNAHFRKRTCVEMSRSGFFVIDGMEPINYDTIYRELRQPRYWYLFPRLYRPTKSRLMRILRRYVYENPYTPRELQVIRFDDGHPFAHTQVSVTEHVFVCLLRIWDTNELSPFQVSKEYDLSGDGEPYTAGRFLFTVSGRLLLAEEPARLYDRPDYNVELHYLHLRVDRQPVTLPDADPVCKFTARNFQNQHHRLCTKVAASLYFGDTAAVGNPTKRFSYSCGEEVISFRTPQGVAEVAGKSYRELMILCEVPIVRANGPLRLRTVYVSRAYISHQVFVYARDSAEDRCICNIW